MTKIYHHPANNTSDVDYTKGIPANSVFICDGGAYQYAYIDGDVGEGATIIKSNSGNIHFTGNIGANVVFRISGLGNVSINGKVDDSVVFVLEGVGSLSFNTKPSAKVLESILTTGERNIHFSKPQSSLATSNQGLFKHFTPLNMSNLQDDGIHPPRKHRTPQ
ncbi:hypothetical protein [Legionella santicrucis]|uniref:hypothetical protein n=1 Tax=Legionella santicrucis TaxID=45074 RepID=UPI000730A318|nr:hypothetical protein [Legionella santicrucis]